MLLYAGQNDVPAFGQLAVAGTTLLAAVGSTVILNVCISPYVLNLYEVRLQTRVYCRECLPVPREVDLENTVWDEAGGYHGTKSFTAAVELSNVFQLCKAHMNGGTR